MQINPASTQQTSPSREKTNYNSQASTQLDSVLPKKQSSSFENLVPGDFKPSPFSQAPSNTQSAEQSIAQIDNYIPYQPISRKIDAAILDPKNYDTNLRYKPISATVKGQSPAKIEQVIPEAQEQKHYNSQAQGNIEAIFGEQYRFPPIRHPLKVSYTDFTRQGGSNEVSLVQDKLASNYQIPKLKLTSPSIQSFKRTSSLSPAKYPYVSPERTSLTYQGADPSNPNFVRNFSFSGSGKGKQNDRVPPLKDIIDFYHHQPNPESARALLKDSLENSNRQVRRSRLDRKKKRFHRDSSTFNQEQFHDNIPFALKEAPTLNSSSPPRENVLVMPASEKHNFVLISGGPEYASPRIRDKENSLLQSQSLKGSNVPFRDSPAKERESSRFSEQSSRIRIPTTELGLSREMYVRNIKEKDDGRSSRRRRNDEGSTVKKEKVVFRDIQEEGRNLKDPDLKKYLEKEYEDYEDGKAQLNKLKQLYSSDANGSFQNSKYPEPASKGLSSTPPARQIELIKPVQLQKELNEASQPTAAGVQIQSNEFITEYTQFCKDLAQDPVFQKAFALQTFFMFIHKKVEMAEKA